MSDDLESQAQEFRAGTRIIYRLPDDPSPRSMVDVCYVYRGNTALPGSPPRIEYVAESLVTGRHGFGDTADEAYVSLVYRLAREFHFAITYRQEYSTGWHPPEALAFQRARQAPRLGRDRQHRLLEQAAQQVREREPSWVGPNPFDAAFQQAFEQAGMSLTKQAPPPPHIEPALEEDEQALLAKSA